ncbi:hypothetical protein [Nocardia bovistercoris]|uniref:Uncharacterized protein n=1 Tax=Nocardia bovistercoris TaxID=2785916 RepID=A0A931N238_9NOCA|nr:hypothetical protein [Nocardia bovistercoris]MBH0775611.1 hypothetical protein [Nocardia bovistercoris]
MRESVRPRKSTALLGIAWVAIFVLYLFVKPDTTVPIGTGLLINTAPAATVDETAGK